MSERAEEELAIATYPSPNLRGFESGADSRAWVKRLLLPVTASVAILVVMVLWQSPLGEPFGDSHDGRNGATWVAGADALIADPIGNRLGGVRLDGTVYANHPPAILVLVAAGRWALGDSPLAARIVPIAATMAAGALIVLLLDDLGVGAGPVALGSLAFAATPMVRVYGSMVDTPIVALPVAILLLRLAVKIQRGVLRHGDLVVVAIAPLVAWQTVFLCLLLIGWLALRRRIRESLRLAAALGAGLAALFAWLLWVHGSLAPLVDVLLFRSSLDGDTAAGPTAALDLQTWALRVLIGPAIVFLAVAAVAAVCSPDRACRLVAGLGILAVLGYDALLTTGASYHDYWGYWIVVPVAIGAALTPSMVGLAATRGGGDARRASAIAGVITCTVAIAALGIEPPQVPATSTGVDAAQELNEAEPAPGQDALWVLAEFDPDEEWVSQASHVPVRRLTEERYSGLVDEGRLDDVVVVSTACPRWASLCDRIPFPETGYLQRSFHAVRIGDLLASP